MTMDSLPSSLKLPDSSAKKAKNTKKVLVSVLMIVFTEYLPRFERIERAIVTSLSKLFLIDW